MNHGTATRRSALLAGAGGLSLAIGCTSMLARKPVAFAAGSETPLQSTPDPIHIIYRTRTDRLNLAGAQLPHCSIAELRVAFPHYQGKMALCSAVVKTTPCSQSATPFPERGATSTVASLFDGSSSDGSVSASHSWSADVPLWEAQAIIASLEDLNFFRKHRTVLSAEVFLSVETGKYAVGKRYRPVTELDAMILRVVQQQSVTSQPDLSAAERVAFLSAPGELRRLPATN